MPLAVTQAATNASGMLSCMCVELRRRSEAVFKSTLSSYAGYEALSDNPDLDLLWILMQARQALLLLSDLQEGLVCQGRRTAGLTAFLGGLRTIGRVSSYLQVSKGKVRGHG